MTLKNSQITPERRKVKWHVHACGNDANAFSKISIWIRQVFCQLSPILVKYWVNLYCFSLQLCTYFTHDICTKSARPLIASNELYLAKFRNITCSYEWLHDRSSIARYFCGYGIFCDSHYQIKYVLTDNCNAWFFRKKYLNIGSMWNITNPCQRHEFLCKTSIKPAIT